MSSNTINLNFEELTRLRQELHKNAELSCFEFKTKQILLDYLSACHPDEIIDNLGETGFALIFDSKKEGKTILFRADLDALPMKESLPLPYASINPEISHKCGHDGHATILAGLAMHLSVNRPFQGKAVLLFQPAEENGKGASHVLNDHVFQQLKPDLVFALHNLPGFEKNHVVLKKDLFACASKGLVVKLTGKPAHAAYPEQGVSPALAIAELIKKFSALPTESNRFESFIMVTIIHAKIGQEAFGNAPGYAELMVTLRSNENAVMTKLAYECKLIAEEIAKNHGLALEFEWKDIFPATKNASEVIDIAEHAAKTCGLKTHWLPEAFRWSEDFGYFTEKYKGAIIGLGAGINHPGLHAADYDFPDDIIKSGLAIFADICKTFL